MSATEKLRIVFFGTPDFAVPSLMACHEHHQIVAVISQPDRPAGRGHKVHPTPIHRAATLLSLPIYQPRCLSEFDLKHFDADLFVVIAYGQILSAEVLKIPRLGSINVHGSLLPHYRGAAPMQRAIEDELELSGITTMLMDEGLDTGDILLKREILIREMPIQTVHDLFAREGAELLVETISSLAAGTLKPIPQDHTRSSYTKKISKTDFEFRSSETVSKNLARLRAFGYLKTRLHDKQFKLFRARRYPDDVPFDPTRSIRLECSDGWLELLEIQPENAKRMSAQAYLIGYRSDAELS